MVEDLVMETRVRVQTVGFFFYRFRSGSAVLRLE